MRKKYCLDHYVVLSSREVEEIYYMLKNKIRQKIVKMKYFKHMIGINFNQ